jgi:hypothetical protein
MIKQDDFEATIDTLVKNYARNLRTIEEQEEGDRQTRAAWTETVKILDATRAELGGAQNKCAELKRVNQRITDTYTAECSRLEADYRRVVDERDRATADAFAARAALQRLMNLARGAAQDRDEAAKAKKPRTKRPAKSTRRGAR